MKYVGCDKEVRVGDLITTGYGKYKGIVVCDFDNEEYLNDFEGFGTFLSEGIMIDTDDYGLMHYPFETSDLEFVERAMTK